MLHAQPPGKCTEALPHISHEGMLKKQCHLFPAAIHTGELHGHEDAPYIAMFRRQLCDRSLLLAPISTFAYISVHRLSRKCPLCTAQDNAQVIGNDGSANGDVYMLCSNKTAQCRIDRELCVDAVAAKR